ncbi:MAG: AmmeMemoRadiSam system protein B [Bacteroidales bacterium]|nr:AmmeMemoRadiSam system protein B [Bacteroidales bacterium]
MSSLRNPVDSVGFPTQKEQVEAFMKILKQQNLYTDSDKAKHVWKSAIVPHDDYAYVQELFPKTLSGVKAKTVFLIGVAHKAALLNLQDKIVFGSFDYWNAPYGKVKVSEVRNQIIKELDKKLFTINDSMQSIEHSVEPFLPMLQYFGNNFEIVPVLVPYMNFDKMRETSAALAQSIFDLAKKNNWQWGKDFVILISTDAVHYGDEDWGGKNFERFGTDTAGYKKAVAYEHEIIDSCLLGNLSPEKIKKFTEYTVQADNYKEYKWTWCGRYSVPFGLLLDYYLQKKFGETLNDEFIGYSTSIAKPVLDLKAIDMGTTAVANLHHWVGYCAIGYY